MSRKIMTAAVFALIASATSFAPTVAMSDGVRTHSGVASGATGWQVLPASPTTNEGPGTQPADVQQLRQQQAEAACAVFKTEPGRQANCLDAELAESRRVTPVAGSGG